MNKFVKKLEPYKVASHKVWEVDNKDDILKLDWNEATVEPSPHVINCILQAVQDKSFRFYPEIKNMALLNSLSSYTGIGVDNIQYFASSDSAHEYIAKALINEDDNVLILAPSYDNFRTTCEAHGANIHFSLLINNSVFDNESFRTQIENISPKIVYICNPNNPTGTVIDYKDIEVLVSTYPETLFLIDEAYFEFYGCSCSQLINKYNNILITRTFSKAFALAGMRIGYIIAPKFILEQINKVRNAKNIQHLSQVAALAALSDVEYMKSYVQEVKLSKKDFTIFLETQPFVKSICFGEGNFILFQVISMDVKSFLLKHLEKNNIFVRNMSHMDVVKDCIRITIGTREQMEKVKNILREFNE